MRANKGVRYIEQTSSRGPCLLDSVRCGRKRLPKDLVMEMEDSRCNFAAMEMEDPRCKSMLSGAEVTMEDPRCEGLRENAAMVMEDPRCKSMLSSAAMVMDDPRCQNMRNW